MFSFSPHLNNCFVLGTHIRVIFVINDTPYAHHSVSPSPVDNIETRKYHQMYPLAASKTINETAAATYPLRSYDENVTTVRETGTNDDKKKKNKTKKERSRVRAVIIAMDIFFFPSPAEGPSSEFGMTTFSLPRAHTHARARPPALPLFRRTG